MANWTHVDDRIPSVVGNYLCVTNDGIMMVCRLNVIGYWTAVGGYSYGDLHEKRRGRVEGSSEVKWWRRVRPPRSELLKIRASNRYSRALKRFDRKKPETVERVEKIEAELRRFGILSPASEL